MRSVRGAAAMVMAMMALASCSGDDAVSTTSVPPSDLTTIAGTGPAGSEVAPSTAAPGSTAASSTTTVQEGGIPRYRVVSRCRPPCLADEDFTGRIDDRSTVVIMLLDDPDRTTLSDIDLQNVIADVYDRFPPVLEAFVVDSHDAAGYVLLQDPTPEQQAELDEHYFARLEEGLRIVFTGPFEDFGDLFLAS